MVHVDTDVLGGTWDRGDGWPQQRGLDLVLDVVLDNCSPLEVLLFGSGARGELGVASDLDLLVVFAELVEPRRALSFCIEETVGYHPRVRDRRRHRARGPRRGDEPGERAAHGCRGGRRPLPRRRAAPIRPAAAAAAAGCRRSLRPWSGGGGRGVGHRRACRPCPLPGRRSRSTVDGAIACGRSSRARRARRWSSRSSR